MDLTDLFWTFHPITLQKILSSQLFKYTENWNNILSFMCWPQIKLYTYKTKQQKLNNSWKWNSSLLNKMWGQDIKLREELKTYWIKWKWLHNIPELMGYSEGDFKRQVHRNKWLFKNFEWCHNLSNLMAHMKTVDQKEEIIPKRNRQK